jgi:hypothetical protein
MTIKGQYALSMRVCNLWLLSGHMQPTSNRPSAPAIVFGSSSRDAYEKQFANAEVDRAQARARGAIDNNLGACYNIPVSAFAWANDG